MITMNSYLPEKNVIVVGYPRSGNSWLARLLGDALDSPVTGWKKAKPLSEEGADREGDFVVRQLHLRPMYEVPKNKDEFLPSAYLANIRAWNGEKVVHIFRDPRDVAVSVMKYWNIDSLDETLACMIFGKHPVKTHGPWKKFVGSWLNAEDIPVVNVTYELLHHDHFGSLVVLLNRLDLPFDADMVKRAVKNQSFEAKREHIASHGDDYNYGKDIQLKAMRKGIVGDWKNHFNKDHEKIANVYWGDFVKRFFYD